MSRLNNAIRLLSVAGRVNTVNNVHSGTHRMAAGIIDEICAKAGLNDTAVLPPVFRLKMQWYMAEVFFFCGLINELLGRTSTGREKRLYMVSGALGAMCDYLVDDAGVELEWLKSLKFPAAADQGQEVSGRFYRAFYMEFDQLMDGELKERCLHDYSLGFDAQLRSRRQLDPSLSREEADRICRDKGGLSFSFMRSMIPGEIGETENNAWMELGAFIQFCNDAQDLHKDGKKGINTFASFRPDLRTLAADLDRQKCLAFGLMKQLHFDRRRKDHLLFILYAMTIGILTKLHGFSKACEGEYTHEKFLYLSKEEARVNPFSFASLRYGLPKLMAYRYETVDKPFAFSLVS